MINKITIYGMKDCKWCVKAEALAQQLAESNRIDEYEYLSLEEPSMWMNNNGFEGKDRTLPKVYMNNRLVGGFTEFDWVFNGGPSE